MKTVLCYGDSNTHGHVPGRLPKPRYDADVRWTGVMQHVLGANWRVIEEGLSGRTTVHDDPIEGAYKNGRSYLFACLLSHRPLDVVVVMLGTNDLKHRFNLSVHDVAASVGALVDDIRGAAVGPDEGVPEILVVAPAPFCPQRPEYGHSFDGGFEKSHGLAAAYQEMTTERGVYFFDAGSVCQTDPIDGIHLNADAHHTLGQALAAQVRRIGQGA